MQQLYQLLLTKQESLPEISYSFVYRQSKGLFGFQENFEQSTLISDHNNIKCMAISKFGIVFGGDFGVYHQSKNTHFFNLKASQIKFSPDSEYFILIGKETHLISSRTNEVIKTFPDELHFDSTCSLCFCKGSVYETATFSELKKFKCPDYCDFTISTQRDNLYLSSVTLIKHLEDLRECTLSIDNYNTNQHFEHQLPPSNEVKQLWSEDGKVLLIWSQTLDDQTNQSYFGTHHLHLWTENKLIKIDLYEGPLHDVQWVDNGFIAISGYMPAGAVLYNKEGVKQYLLIQAHINSIYRKNNLIALCGFGNLTGDIYIYDTNLMEKVGYAKQDKVVTFEWSPSGEYFILATTLPRRRVDNQFIISTKSGQFLFKQKFEELYEIKWISDQNITIPNNIIEEVKQSKEVNLNTGIDFIKQLKEIQILDQPRKFEENEQLFIPKPIVQQPQPQVQQLVPQKQVQKAVFMRRQEPLVHEPITQEQEDIQKVQLQKVEKKQNKKANKYPKGLKYQQQQINLDGQNDQQVPQQEIQNNQNENYAQISFWD